MKRIFNLINLALAFVSVFYTVYHMGTGDICRTIVGCTMLMMWFWIFRREN